MFICSEAHFSSGLKLLRSRLLTGLVFTKTIPRVSDLSHPADNTLIYVLGGTQKSYLPKFRIAGLLYKQGVSKKILCLNDNGLTGHDAALKRNLTGNEWNGKELRRQNVRMEDIEFVPVPQGFFGTFNEAKEISRIVLGRGCKRLVLVASDYHTRRVWMSFSNFLKNTPVELYVYGASDTAVSPIPLEFAKLMLYELLLRAAK